MDFSPIIALLGAVGTLISAATAFLKLWSKSDRKQLLVIITAVFLVSGIVAVVGGLKLYTENADLKKTEAYKLQSIFRGFGFADFRNHADNANSRVIYQEGIQIPNNIQQYSVSKDGILEQPQRAQYIPRPDKKHQYLLFFSQLQQDKCGWSNVRIIPLQVVNLINYESLVFLMESDADDLLEIKLKDKNNTAEYRPLLVKKGWGEYILSLDRFQTQGLNLELIIEFSIAHSCGYRIKYKQLLDHPVFQNTFRLLFVSPPDLIY